jgi:pilus assembly protein CpaF
VGALAGLFPAGERVVSVEEVSELAASADQWIALEARPEVALSDVLRAAIRMRPDRLIVGEVRGVEAFELVSAMASAAEGTLISVGGEGVGAALSRLESLVRLGAPDASPRGLKELVAHAAHVVVHVARYADGVRRVASIAEVAGVEGDGWATRELFSFQLQGHGEDGRLRGRFAAAGVIPRFYEMLEARGIPADPAVFR